MAVFRQNEKTEDRIKVLVPGSIEPKSLYLADGRVFNIVSTDNGLFKKRILLEDNKLWGRIDDLTLSDIVNINSLEKQGNSCIDDFVSLGTSAIDPLLKTILQEQRRKLIESSSGQLEILFKDFFSKNKDDIAKIFAAKKTDGVISVSGLIPRSTRFIWEMKSSTGNKYAIYCLELPPHRRHIKLRINSQRELKRYNWAIPWLCILAIFKNGQFNSLSAFYRDKPLNGEDNSIMKCGLPGKYSDVPWTFCDGNSAPSIELSDPKWVDKLLIWFFDSTFIYHDNAKSYDHEFYDIYKTVPELKSFSAWDFFSNSGDYLQRVCEVKFPLFHLNLKQCVIEIMKFYLQGEVQESSEVIREKEFASLSEKFEQAVREKFVFLVGKTAIHPDVSGRVRSLVVEALNSLKARLQIDLGKKLKGLGVLIKQTLSSSIQRSEKEKT